MRFMRVDIMELGRVYGVYVMRNVKDSVKERVRM